MAGTIKGMTIEIGGNTTPLEQALKGVNKEIRGTQSELKEVDRLLKLDPKNVDLLKQKQQILGEQIGNTTKKLEVLKEAQSKLDAEMKNGGEVNQQEYRKLQREIASTESSLTKLKDTNKENNKQLKEASSHLVKFAEGLKVVGEKSAVALKALTDFTVMGVKAMAGATLGAVTALGNLAVKAGQTADDLNTMSAVTGLSTKQLQEFSYASDLIDVSMDTLSGSLKKITSSMNSAKDGTGKQAEAFKKLGVNIKDAQGNLRNSSDVFNDAIRALGNIANETERDAMAMELFGKSATDLNPLIEGGIDTLEKMSKQANELGLVLSQEALDGANAFNDQIDILKANGKQTFQVIGTEIASQLTPAMEKLNGEIMQVIKSLTGALSEGGLEGLFTELSKQFGNFLSKLTQALPKIAQIGVNMIKNLVGAIKQNSAQIGQAGAELVVTLIEGFYEVLPDLIETAIIMLAQFVQTLAEKLPDLIPVIVEGLIAVADVIVNNLDLIIDAGIQLILGLIQGLEKALPILIAKLPEILQKVAQTIIQNLPTIIEAVGIIIVAIVNTIGQSASQLVEPTLDCIFGVIDTIVENLPTIIDTIIEVILAIVDALVDNIGLIIDAGFRLIVGLAEGLVKAIPKIVEKLPEIMMAIVNGLIALVGKLWEVVAPFFEALGNGLINGVSALGNAIANIWEWIKTAITEQFREAREIGQNFVKGLWEGIKNAKDWLFNKISEWCGSILNGIKAFFGIQSPSKVMANEVGNFMAEGIGVGFAKTMPSVISAMQDKLSSVTSALQTELSFGDIPQIQGNQIISENQYVTRNYTNTIETVRQPQAVELVLDGTKLARTIIPPLNDEYNRLGVKI